MTKMRAGFLQYDIKLADKAENRKRVGSLLGDTQFDLLVLPELALTGYVMSSRERTAELAEEFPTGETFEFFRSLARRGNGAVIFGFAERAADRLYNAAAMVLPEGSSLLYRKTHLFFLEKTWYDPGDTGFNVFEFRGVKIGLMVCFDWYFPEAARTLMLRGAEVICHPANLVLPYCQDAMVTRCLENRVFAVTCNRIGMEQLGKEKLVFTGRSQIVSPKGEVLVRADGSANSLEIIEIDPTIARNKAVTPHNNLIDDRRDSFYN